MCREFRPLVVICGPTASGKTRLSVALAQKIGGEVISADSMQLYTGMNIGTAKPPEAERCGISHHMLDIISPEESYSVARYVQDAKKCYEEIRARGKIPVLTGGTGLYIDAFVKDANFTEEEGDREYRKNLYAFAEMNSPAALYKVLAWADPERAKELHENDVKRVVRALEYKKAAGASMRENPAMRAGAKSPYHLAVIFLNFKDRAALYERIDRRAEEMFQNGLVEETKRLLSRYDLKESTAMQAIGYKEVVSHLAGEESLESAIERVKLSSRRYAKRQLTWFRRMDFARELFVDDFKSFDALLQEVFKWVEKSGVLSYNKHNLES